MEGKEKGARSVADGVRVVVVGAGVAGLSAALHLYTGGFTDITVLEASNRAGGRVYSVKFGTRGTGVVELGANFVEGDSLSNSFFVLASQNGLVPKPLDILDRAGGYFYRSDGRPIDRELSTTVWKQCVKFFNSPPESGVQNLDAHLRSKIESFIESEFTGNARNDAESVMQNFLSWCMVYQGTNKLNMLPVNTDNGYIDVPGPYHSLHAGMQSVTDSLVQQLPFGSVKYNHRVVNIEWGGPRVRVACENGEEYEADHVIITVPLGHLKANHHSLFTPLLPGDKIHAISKIPFGKIGKMIFEWGQPFWQEGLCAINFAWLAEEADVRSPKEWYKRVRVLDELPNNQGVLLAFMGGEETEYMETLSDQELIDTITGLLRRFLNNPSIPAPDRVIRTKWCTNHLFGGVYSYWDLETRAEHMESLATPLLQTGTSVPRLLFAGEATIFTGYGFVHGARDSGLREAQRLLDLYKLSPSKL